MEPSPSKTEHPVSSKKTARIAAKLSTLPFELIEPVLAELPLYHVLQLYCASTTKNTLHHAIQQSPSWSWLFQGHHDRLAQLWIVANRFSMLWCGRAFIQRPVIKLWHDSSSKLQNREWEEMEPNYLRDWLNKREIKLQPATSNDDNGWINEWDQPSIKQQAAESKRDSHSYYIVESLEKDFILTLSAFVGSSPRRNPWHARFDRHYYWGRGLKRVDRRAACMFLPRSLLSSLIDNDKVSMHFELNDPGAVSVSDYISNAPSVEYLDKAADAIRAHDWTMEEAIALLPWIERAFELLRKSKSDQLAALARLYDKFPDLLKMPLASQYFQPNRQRHVSRNLHVDVGKALGSHSYAHFKKFGPSGQEHSVGRPWFRFRYAHCSLVPYDWCFNLFAEIMQKKLASKDDSNVSSELLSLLKIAESGFNEVYSYGETPIGRVATVQGKTCFVFRPDQSIGLPVHPKEMEWLTAFVECVDWARSRFPDEYDASYRGGTVSPVPGYSKSGIWATMDSVDYESFVKKALVSDIAKQLQRDSKLSDEIHRHNPTKQPSLLALHLSSLSSSRKTELVEKLFPSSQVGADASNLVYDSMVHKITAVIKSDPHSSDECLPLPDISSPAPAGQVSQEDDQRASQSPSEMTAEKELQICEKILQDLLLTKDEQDQNILHVLSEVRSKMSEFSRREETFASQRKDGTPRLNNKPIPLCYICRLHRRERHPLLPALCKVCGDFNSSASRMSLPHNLRLNGRTALVTGGRVNLGFHTALRLLRCGASVIVSTRYPADAAVRYRSETDCEAWESRLKIVGADFRSAADAMALAEEVKRIVRSKKSGLDGLKLNLDILINNAAQTLVDGKEKEMAAVTRERALLEDLSDARSLQWLPKTGYTARIQGVSQPNSEAISFGKVLLESQDANSQLTAAPEKGTDSIVPYTKSSWVQSLHEIPYEDLISAHSVNTFVPLILIRELLPVMPVHSRKLSFCSYIINVSSREGIFEAKKRHPAKGGKHVHTNMSKAGLNMITETEAAEAWDKYKVAMNTVDPGYMSAAPELEDAFDGERPIGWSDGAGRVLWPIAKGEAAQRKGDGKVIWGQFLKHYGAVRVEPAFGRG